MYINFVDFSSAYCGTNQCLSIWASLMSLDWSVVVTLQPALPSTGGEFCPALFPFQSRTGQLQIFQLRSSPLQWSILRSLRPQHPQSLLLLFQLHRSQLPCPLSFQGLMALIPPLQTVLRRALPHHLRSISQFPPMTS